MIRSGREKRTGENRQKEKRKEYIDGGVDGEERGVDEEKSIIYIGE